MLLLNESKGRDVNKIKIGSAKTPLLLIFCLLLLSVLFSYVYAQSDKATPVTSDKATPKSQQQLPQRQTDLGQLLTANTTTVVIYVIAILILKLTAFFIGFKTVVMGHDLLIKGIKGDFDFTFSSNSAISTKLQSASPGTFFVLLGTALIAWGLFVEKPMSIKLSYLPQGNVQTQGNPPTTPGDTLVVPQGGNPSTAAGTTAGAQKIEDPATTTKPKT